MKITLPVFTALFTLCLFTKPTLSQSANDAGLNLWKQHLNSITKYPKSQLRSNKPGFAVFELSFNKSGEIASINPIQSTNKEFLRS